MKGKWKIIHAGGYDPRNPKPMPPLEPKKKTAKRARNFWPMFRDRIIAHMRHNPNTPLDAAYAVRYGGRTYFGADTYDLTERVLAMAKKDARVYGQPRILAKL